MAYFYIVFLIIGIILIIFLVLGLPRKKNARKPSIEGLYDPEVAKAFEKMTNLVPFKILRRRILSELKKYSLEGKLVDLGCGSGNLLVLISKKYPTLELIGVDISSEILELAKLKTQGNELTDNVDFRVGGADSLPFLDNSVDFIISSLSLHHWKDPSIVLKEIYRVLKHNGVL
ncbi:MAG: class I SAM-dependent methyltransferase, partial [Candidatus Lokiarchaeia archaeon]|nr:class I SAM-dependent methyltransferase [Candidatus Lokiarchaeia archaeon]